MSIFPHRPRCAAAILALATMLVSASAARSQEHSALERLDRVERDLNMLQRQVYRGMPAPAGGGALVNAEIRMDRLEEQMRELTGRVEELMNQVAQMRQRVEQVNSDIDMRVGRAAGPGRSLAASEAPARPGAPVAGPSLARPARTFPPPPAEAVEEDAPPARVAGGPGRAMAPPLQADPAIPIFGTLTPPGPPIGPPPAYAGPPEPEPPATRAVAAPMPNGAPASQYNHAFGLLKQADYAGAESELKAFVDQHPKDPMAGNAQYWLGETYYARGRYLEAATAFAEGYKRYPKNTKAPDGLLKLGMALSRANQKQNACVALAQLDRDFPDAGAAVKQHAAAEKKRLGC